ncbi:hypothetical protein [Mycolicibacterium helvum]|uniref:Uncharacterized protein n=1 Tax=Mycolicibacterium helvum TaxID=1534349 RepID=A0A7I7SYI3_9MYCO|nr:hypothetical protein [Mycolicibacterium helvum]BBY62094.1 hypothetical protein MHEL_03370 [Mycolicibacterium helvum]
MTAKDLHPATHLRAAAWVPDDDPQRPWEEAISLAAQWLWKQSEAEGVPPLVVSNARNAAGWGYTDLDEIIRAGGHATPKSRTRPDRGPVLAFAPIEGSLQLAMDLARGYSLAVVEGSLLPLAEWAARAGATNLVTDQATASQIPDDVREDLDSVVFYGGRNGWTGPDEKVQAKRFLSPHVRTGRLTPNQAAAYALASQSVSDRGAKRLRDLLGRGRYSSRGV